MAGGKQSPLERTASFQPPWRERLPNGELGQEYGPSPATLSRRIKAFRMWTWRPSGDSERKRQEGQLLKEWLEEGARERVSQRELETYQLLYEQGQSTRGAAQQMGVSRATVREYRKRLFKRMENDSD